MLQKNGQGTLQPCAYTSRKLTDTERAWAIWEKEAFAIRWALSTWRHLLEGAKEPFEVWTDHKNLEAPVPQTCTVGAIFPMLPFSFEVCTRGKKLSSRRLVENAPIQQ